MGGMGGRTIMGGLGWRVVKVSDGGLEGYWF